MVDVPTKKEIVGLVEAQATSIDSISERLVKLENLIEKQDSKNNAIIIGAVLALIFIVGTVAIEVLLSDKNDSQFYSGLQSKIYDQNVLMKKLNDRFDNLKILNPYLK
jgi:hypothetical protein